MIPEIFHAEDCTRWLHVWQVRVEHIRLIQNPIPSDIISLNYTIMSENCFCKNHSNLLFTLLDKILIFTVNYFYHFKIFYFTNKILSLDMSQEQPALPMRTLVNSMVCYHFVHTGKQLPPYHQID